MNMVLCTGTEYIAHVTISTFQSSLTSHQYVSTVVLVGMSDFLPTSRMWISRACPFSLYGADYYQGIYPYTAVMQLVVWVQ